MGQLKPGATYIYEKADGITYAREFGSSPNTRFEIGRDYDRTKKDEEELKIDLWKEILDASNNNSMLQKALERAKIDYYLSKEYEERYGRKT
jgi:hypothetical protein